MPRPLRIEYEDAWYHVMNRGANRQVMVGRAKKLMVDDASSSCHVETIINMIATC